MMRTTQTIRTGLAALALAGAALAAPQAGAEEMQLRTGFFMGERPSPYVTAYKRFIEEVNATGEGQVRIVSYVGPESVQRNQWCNAVRSGILDLIAVGPGLCNNLVKISEGLNGQTISFAEQRENGAYDFMREVWERDANSYFLGQFASGARFHFFTDEPVETLEDMKTVRMRNSATLRGTYEALGIDGVEVPLNQIYTSVERGVLDGASLPFNVIEPLGLHEVVTHRVDPGFFNPVMMVLVNMDVWERMTEAQRTVLHDAAIKLETEFDEGFGETNEAMGAALLEKGITLVELPPADAERLQRTANDSLWAQIEESAPEEGPRMRSLIDPQSGS